MANTTFYEFTLYQVQKYLREISTADIENEKVLNVFDISAVMEIIFDKPKEEIILDITKRNMK